MVTGFDGQIGLLRKSPKGGDPSPEQDWRWTLPIAYPACCIPKLMVA